MKVSIAMATYNGERYLQDQLNSFLNQIRLPDELVISDDCSKDSTLDILEKFKKDAPFKVIILKNEINIGYCGNFNRSLLETTGDLILLSDQDDFWFPDKIKKMIHYSESSNAKLFLNDVIITNNELKPSNFTQLKQVIKAKKSDKFYVLGCAMIVKREFLNYCLPIPKNILSHDVWIAKLSIGLNVRQIVEEPLQYYRRHESNETNYLVNKTAEITLSDRIIDKFKKTFSLFDQSNKLNSLTNFENQIREMLKRINSRGADTYIFIDSVKLNNFRSRLILELSYLKFKRNLNGMDFTKRVLFTIKNYRKGIYSGKKMIFIRIIKDVIIK